MKRIDLTAILLLAAATMVGCDTEGLYETTIDVGEAVTLAKGVVIHERSQDRLVYLEASKTKAVLKELYRAEDDERLVWSKAGPDPKNPTQLFEMSVPKDERDVDSTETLLRIRVDGTVDSFEVNSLFSKLAFGPLHRFAVLYHDPEKETESDLYNPNEVAIVDLSKKPSESNPRLLSIDLKEQNISGVSFLPELTVAGVKRQFAVFLGQGQIRLVDLIDPNLASAGLRLVHKGDQRTVSPLQLLIRNEDGTRETMVFVRAVGSEDVYAISLTASDNSEHAFMATLNQLEAGGEPLDMALVQDGDNPLLTVLSRAAGNVLLNVINVDTADAFTVNVDDTVSRVLLREVDGAEEVVLFGDDTSGIHFLKADGLGEERGRNLEHLLIPDRVQRALPLDEARLLIVPGNEQDLVLLDLDTRDSTRLISPFTMDLSGAQMNGDLFFCVPEDKDRVNVVDMRTGHPDSLLLDDRISSLHLLKGSNVGVALHDTPTGRVTVFPLSAHPTREEANVLDGLWLDGFLDEEEVSR
ncbi:MAG: hypothetical protein GY854_28860 [Deltaproteobacteria bacterium]|nr:hypothetical protein [Deltaproteobacteria bacterium]